MDLPPGASTVQIDLTEVDGVTTLHLVHRGIPAGFIEAHEFGWRFSLAACATCSTPTNPA